MAPFSEAVRSHRVRVDPDGTAVFAGTADAEWTIGPCVSGPQYACVALTNAPTQYTAWWYVVISVLLNPLTRRAGYVLALVVDACIQHQAQAGGAHPDPLHASAHFLKASRTGAFEARVRTLRAGKGYANVLTDFVQDVRARLPGLTFSMCVGADGRRCLCSGQHACHGALHLRPSSPALCGGRAARAAPPTRHALLTPTPAPEPSVARPALAPTRRPALRAALRRGRRHRAARAQHAGRGRQGRRDTARRMVRARRRERGAHAPGCRVLRGYERGDAEAAARGRGEPAEGERVRAAPTPSASCAV
jgi:hypothetical protein